MNKIILMGRLTKDPEIRYSAGENPQAVARYSLAVERRSKKDPGADFFNCVAFGRAGEWAQNYLFKGMKITVAGHVQTGSYVNKEGQKVYTSDVIVEEHYFCESKSSERANSAHLPEGEAPLDEEMPFC